MLLNYAAPKIMPNVVTAPKSNIDVNAILGLTPSQYEGLQKVGDTGYYYGDNKMYEPYTPSPVSYYMSGPFGMTQYQPTGLMPSAPSIGPFGYSGGWQASGGPAAGTITRGDQSFKPVNVDVTGFSKNKVGEEGSETYEYSPSMAYIYSKTQPQVTAQPNVSAVTTPGYTPASGSLLTAPTMPSYTGNYGAGRFLNTGNLLGFNFTPSQTTASPGQSPAI